MTHFPRTTAFPLLSRPFSSPAMRSGAVAVAAALALAGCSGERSPAPGKLTDAVVTPPSSPYQAEIRRTAFGIPHIVAYDETGIGFGVGYAYAQDNLCLLADEIVTVNGERAKYFGPTALRTASTLPNLQTDFFYRLINQPDTVALAWEQTAAPMKALIDGYVEGYNHFLAQAPVGAQGAECRTAPWLRKIGRTDIIKLLRRYAAEAGAGQFVGALLSATPPGAASSAPDALAAAPVRHEAVHAMQPEYWKRLYAQTGSNGVALGSEATANGKGMLLGNPHFPWYGSLRFYQLHLTIPGKLDVMGASIGGMPMVNIGFNKDVAWTHTVNSSAHFTVHALTLDPTDATAYIVDGQRVPMTKKTISVEVQGPGGVLATVSRDFYATRFGNMLVIPGMLGWGGGMGFALRDANLENHRMLEQWSAMGTARNANDLRNAINRVVGLPWVNTIAADRDGNALYMDVTVVPNVSQAKQAACVPPPFAPLAAQGLFVLSGSTMQCQWSNDPAAPQEGIFAGYGLPQLTRADYVQNSNDSAWLSNPAAPLTGFPAIVSTDSMQLMPRARLGITQLRARLSNSDGLGGNKMLLSQLQTLVLNNRVYYADLLMDDVLRLCAAGHAATSAAGAAVDLGVPCARLAAWDRTAGLQANTGYIYFAGMFSRIAQLPGLWTVPFNPADPVNTPRGLNLANPVVAGAARQALAESWLEANAQGISPDAKWGQVQVAVRGARLIPISGGEGELGIYNAIKSTPIGPGVRNVIYGTSYIQTVQFADTGVEAQAFLAYSQSTDPASPYYADQTERFSSKAWINQPFTDEQIKSDPQYKTVTVKK